MSLRGATMLTSYRRLSPPAACIARSRPLKSSSCMRWLMTTMAAWHQAVVDRAGVPLPHPLALYLALRGLHRGKRIVDEDDVAAAAEHGATDADGVVDAAFVRVPLAFRLTVLSKARVEERPVCRAGLEISKFDDPRGSAAPLGCHTRLRSYR